MDIKKAIITAAGIHQRRLPLQTLVDRDGTPKSALAILIEEVLAAQVEEICVVISPGDQAAYAAAAAQHAGRLRFLEQQAPQGYGHAVHVARDFVGDEPFLLLVGDHLYVSGAPERCAQQLVAVASREHCAVSAVQPTHESKLPYYGTVGGRRVAGQQGLYEIAEVIEKPTPTQAEQKLIVPGLRAGHYLCFFGMHVLTPVVMRLLAEDTAHAAAAGNVHLTPALARLAGRERYLAAELAGRRYDIGVKYGLFTAQLALALEGRDRDEVLSHLVELLATRRLS
ncbi:MAG: UTP--glucose-1-phosphate uridylyltransferase [Verrucomicrobia bacterium]|nr:UTP--glucose-1-phosphate uridylyltransferase [Verrucomicrobiota bacterium]